jgi:hypothetical protein
MARYEYMRIPISAIPECIMIQYNLAPLVHNGFVMVEIRKGMYGLPQAGLIAQLRLIAHLATFGYHPAKHTAGLFLHDTRPISFTLCVDDFGVKYVGREHAEHLLGALESLYSVTCDWDGIANDTVKQRRSKAIDMRFYWIKDRVANGEFIVHWRRGLENDADYFTKHHAPSHHRCMRSRYLHDPSSIIPDLARGCVDTTSLQMTDVTNDKRQTALFTG